VITIAFLNIKGGVGKTTTSINVAAGLVDKGKRVLFIDYDKQGNASRFFPSSSTVTIGDVMLDIIPIEQAMFKVEENFHFIHSAMDIKQVEIELQRDPTGGKHDILHNYLKRVKDNFDYCIIDCHPDMNILIINDIHAIDKLIITIKPEPFAFDGFQNTLDNIEMFKDKLNLSVDIYVLFTIVTRIKDEKMMIKSIQDFLGDRVFKTQVRYQNAPIVRAALEKKMVIRNTLPLPGVAKDLRDTVDEILRRFSE
jgi:chromosome partitioning protein